MVDSPWGWRLVSSWPSRVGGGGDRSGCLGEGKRRRRGDGGRKSRDEGEVVDAKVEVPERWGRRENFK
jgi:hypothetical protein